MDGKLTRFEYVVFELCTRRLDLRLEDVAHLLDVTRGHLTFALRSAQRKLENPDWDEESWTISNRSYDEAVQRYYNVIGLDAPKPDAKLSALISGTWYLRNVNGNIARVGARTGTVSALAFKTRAYIHGRLSA